VSSPDGRPTRTVTCHASGAVSPTPPLRWKWRGGGEGGGGGGGGGGAFVARGSVEERGRAMLH